MVQARYANRYRSEISPLKVEDWVLLRRKKTDKTKFAPIADGSFRILEVGINNIKLKFLRNSIAYFVVNISRVQLYFGPRPEIFIESSKNDVEYDYLIDRVMNHKVIDGKHYYYIHWKDYSVEDDKKILLMRSSISGANQSRFIRYLIYLNSSKRI